MTPLIVVISKYTFSLITMKIVPSGCQKHFDPVCPLKGICNKRNCHYLHPSVLLIGRRDTQNNKSYQRMAHKDNPRYDHNRTEL